MSSCERMNQARGALVLSGANGSPWRSASGGDESGVFTTIRPALVWLFQSTALAKACQAQKLAPMLRHNSAVAARSWFSSMEFKTPRARTAAVLPAANPSAMRAVEWISVKGMAASAWLAAPASKETGRDRHTTPGQPLAQPLPCPGQPASDRRLRESELMRRRGVGQPLQVAEDDGDPKPLGQTIDLLVKDLPIGIVLAREISFRRSAPRRAG